MVLLLVKQTHYCDCERIPYSGTVMLVRPDPFGETGPLLRNTSKNGMPY